MDVARFGFRFDARYRVLALPFGVTERNSYVEVADDHLTVRFGLWTLRTPVANVVGCERTGPYTVPKTIGPAHLSLADRGITFATNAEAGLCLCFAEPVRAIDPFGLIRHPAATVTVEDLDELADAVTAARDGSAA